MSEWINSNKQLPKKSINNTEDFDTLSDNVLVIYGDNIYDIGLYDYEYGNWVSTDGMIIYPDYWMPLPSLPDKD